MEALSQKRDGRLSIYAHTGVEKEVAICGRAVSGRPYRCIGMNAPTGLHQG